MNHHAKFYTTSFIFARKYYNRTKLQKKNKQTINDISTSCLSACVDNNCHRHHLTYNTHSVEEICNWMHEQMPDRHTDCVSDWPID